MIRNRLQFQSSNRNIFKASCNRHALTISNSMAKSQDGMSHPTNPLTEVTSLSLLMISYLPESVAVRVMT